ncbi:MAG: exosortase/archaeosortase family protein [Verrucomicrobiota bacterium]
MSIPATAPLSPVALPPGRPDVAATATLVLAGLLAAAFYTLFWSEWRGNPDLSHAIFTPVLFVVLLHEARARGPWRWLPTSARSACACALALIAGLVLLAAGGLYAVALDWSNALVGFILAAALALLLLAALLGLAGDRVRAVPFNWPALAALALWPLSAPIPPGTYTRLTGSLQLWVTGVVLHALNLLVVPSIQNGNVITLSHATVGVEEACSGVRSLVACIVAAIFFSAMLVRRPAARALLLALAAPLAVGMNVVRSLTLTLLANGGTDITGAWHDWTGFAVLGVTAVLLGGLALVLETRAPAAPPPANPPAGRAARRWFLPGGLALAAALVGVFVFNTHGPRADTSAAVAPDLAQILPTLPAGWATRQTDLHRFSATLETDHLIQRDYVREAPDGLVQITLYVAWWPAGAVPVSLVESHTPEACWPGSGWVQQPSASRTAALMVAGRVLPAPTYLLFKDRDNFPQHTWFWHLNAGRPIQQINPLSPRDLLRLSWRHGFHTSGEQLFVRVSSNRPWEQIAAEPLLAEFFARLQPLGLTVAP